MVANSPDDRGLVYAQRRPAEDSLPAVTCPVEGCGVPDTARTRTLPLRLNDGFTMRRFCSLGCCSRWSIREELRQP